jgi:phosphonopyruvate decarboxylase
LEGPDVLDCKLFYDALVARGIDFFAGVPDSLLKDFCAYVTDHTDPAANVITANEGSAIGLAAGRYLATGKPALVYMQNSGLGNAVNPLTSLADAEVYGVPMVLLIGWRGEPGKKDEPQHVKMGAVMLEVLDAIDIGYTILPDEPDEALAALDDAVAQALDASSPYALVVRKGTFAKYKLTGGGTGPAYPLSREEAIAAFLEAVPEGTPVVSTTGMPSRELFELREARGEAHETDFLTVGSMGHSSHIALGVASSHPGRDVYCLDGDGAALMHLGGLAIIGTAGLANYKHIVLNNGAHDSVGGQPTVGFRVDLGAVAKACGYREAWRAETREELVEGMARLREARGPALLEVRVKKGNRPDLGRPTMTPQDLKRAFMKALQGR